jgi:hypothetical protein
MLHYFGYFLLWPLLFAFAILPGVLIGVRVRTWQSSVVLAEIFTVAVALILFEPTQAIFGEQLLLTHIALSAVVNVGRDDGSVEYVRRLRRSG